MPVAAETYLELAYTYDGTLEGLLSCIFEAYANHDLPLDIVPEANIQPRLGQIVRHIPTDVQHAQRVKNGICKNAGYEAFRIIKRASLCDNEDKGMAIYRFVQYIMQKNGKSCHGCVKNGTCDGICTKRGQGGVMSDPTHPVVNPVYRMANFAGNEEERMRQFARFQHLENGVWFARVNPAANVIPMVMPWFSQRFNTQPFIVYDEVHHVAGVYEGKTWYLVQTTEMNIPGPAAEDQLMQRAWRQFYKTVAVESRYNPELRRHFMPVRFWKNLTEMQEELPNRLARR